MEFKICPKCQRSALVSERVENDKKTKKFWKITYCAKCAYNYDLEECKEKVLSAEEELEIKNVMKNNVRRWPKF